MKGNCGVSIVRSGEAMEKALQDCCRFQTITIHVTCIIIHSLSTYLPSYDCMNFMFSKIFGSQIPLRTWGPVKKQ